eukprot:tig00001086_g6850.t1
MSDLAFLAPAPAAGVESHACVVASSSTAVIRPPRRIARSDTPLCTPRPHREFLGTAVTFQARQPARAAPVQTVALFGGDDDAKEVETRDGDCVLKLERFGWRQRRISGSVLIGAPREHVWELLTAYDKLSDFIPNLAESRILDHPDGGIRMEQIGILSRKFRLTVSIVMDVEESYPSKIDFTMVKCRDFKSFVGIWTFEEVSGERLAALLAERGLPPPDASASERWTELGYVLDVVPRGYFPIPIVEAKLMKDLPRNLRSIRARAERDFASLAAPAAASSI